MAHFNSFAALKICGSLCLAGLLYLSCTPKHLSKSTGDAKIYNDDSEITMKASEKKSKMPFDTSSAPVMQRKYEDR